MSRANEPVFPVARDLSGTMNYGLSVREEFAKAAMQGLLASGFVRETVTDKTDRGEVLRKRTYNLSQKAVMEADALIAELAKPVSP